MKRSQNVIFFGDPPPPREFAHPAGEGLAYQLFDALSAAGIPVSEPDNWRDTGWSLTCAMSRGDVQIVMASWGEGEWMLQVAPVRAPGLVDRLLGRSIPELSNECQEISRAIDAILKTAGNYSSINWRADDPPDA